MRITFLLPKYKRQPVGGYRVIYEHANRLTARGHQLTVLHATEVATESCPWWKRAEIAVRHWKYACQDHRVGWMKIADGVMMRRVPSLAEKYVPPADVILATAWETAAPVASYAPDKGRKFYFIQSHETFRGDEAQVEAAYRLPLARIVIAGWLEELLTERGLAVAGRVPNAVDHEVYRIRTPVEQRDPRRIGMLYHRVPVKGTPDGLEALRLARQEIPDLQPVLFGTYERGADLPDYAEFHRAPSGDALAELYNSCAGLVNPSRREGWALVPAEAMACGCALAATDIGGVRDYAAHEQTALLSPPDQPEALARHIVRLVKDEPLRLRLAAAGAARMHEFNWAQSVEQLEKILTGRANET